MAAAERAEVPHGLLPAPAANAAGRVAEAGPTAQPAAAAAAATAPAVQAVPGMNRAAAPAHRAAAKALAQRSDLASGPARGVAPPALAPHASGSLLAAARAGDLEGARRLLAAGGPDDEQDADGRTALAHAVLRSDAPLVALLLAHGADRLRPDRLGLTPMDQAATIGNPEVLATLNRR
jgi:hypothetical protein